MHLIIYSPILTPRIKYIFNFIFRDILKVEVEFTSTVKYFLESEKTKISYTEQPLGTELFFKNTALLYYKKVEPIQFKTIKFGDYKVPFEVQQSALPFDVFAVSFFIISRYEEYLFQENSAANFKASNSYQYKWKLLDKPIIDEWALLIKNLILKKYPNFKFPEKKFSYHNTINFSLKPDVPKGIISKSKFIFSSIFNKNQKYLSNLFDEFVGLGIDRALIIKSLDKIINQENTICFVNFPADLIKPNTFFNSAQLLKDKKLGLLMPCSPRLEKGNNLKSEITKLKEISNNLTEVSSQQLDDLKIPLCYLNLLSNGITSDYSMGYNTELGFRAGTCTPFYWYDLQLDKATSLHVKSYCVSDIGLLDRSEKDAIQTVKNYVDSVKLVAGDFNSTWQLKNLSENAKFKKLNKVFNSLLKYIGN